MVSASFTRLVHVLGLSLMALAMAVAAPLHTAAAQHTPPPTGGPSRPFRLDRSPGASPTAVMAAERLGRGVNFGNIFEAPNEGEWGLVFSQRLVDRAWQAGFRSVRLPVRWSNHAAASAPYTIDPVFAARVQTAVDALLARGFTVVLDMHHHRQLDGDPLDPGEFAVAPAVLEDRFVAMWGQIARRYADYDDRLLFELYNEPHGRLSAAAWNSLAARALAEVRKSNPTRVVVIGPVQWNNAYSLAQLQLPFDTNLIVTIHQYEPFAFTHQGAEWISPALPTGVTCCTATQRQAIVAPLDVAQAWSRTHRYPVFVGEFGAYSRAPAASRIAFNRFMRDAAEARGMRWQYWEFASGFGVYDPGADTFRAELLDSLVGDAAASPQPAQQPRLMPQSRPVDERPRNAPDRRLAPSQRER